MAFKVREASEGGSFKRYVGVGTIKVLAVNPTMEEWNKITNGNMTKEPVYHQVANDVRCARITFLTEVVRPDALAGVIIPISFWLRHAPMKSQSGKVQVIDKYGRTAWATEEEISAKRIPQYANGPANLDTDYRKMYSGESALTDFLKMYMNIPAVSFFNATTGKTEEYKGDKADCEARLSSIGKYFEGDVKELKELVKQTMIIAPNNAVRVLFGVKNVDGKEYQDVFMDLFMGKNNINNPKFQKALEDVYGSTYDNTFFGKKGTDGKVIITELEEYAPEGTQYSDSGSTIPGENPGNSAAAEKKDNLPF